MNNFLDHELLFRVVPFIAIFLVMAAWEILAPRRYLHTEKSYRWANNFSIFVVGSLFLRVLFPAQAVGVAVFVDAKNWGLFHLDYFSQWHALWPMVLGFVVLDFTVWLQHVIFHALPTLWRLHRMHHTDTDFDLSTALRFHPLELILSMGIKTSVIAVLGIPVVAVLVFEVVLNTMAMFNHSNVKIPLGLDRWLRFLLVTPDMHRVHHSWHAEETHSNFGFNLSCWDRLFGTYRSQPKEGHEAMTIGLSYFRERSALRFDQLLIQPFVSPKKTQ